MSDSPIRLEHRGSVAVITLEDPQRRNALSAELLTALAGALEAADRDPAVAAAVVTGGAERFAAGADVRELLAATPAAYARSPRAACWDRLGAIGLPLVAGVAGPALGGGCELALLADLVVAGDNARFGQPEVRLGLLPGAGGTQRWARGRALRRRRGRARRPHARRLRAARARARQLASCRPSGWSPPPSSWRSRSPPARRWRCGPPRAPCGEAEQLPLAAALEHERAQLQTLLSTDDCAEGITAFLERREPAFAGR